MDEEQIRHRGEDQRLVSREGKTLDNPASTKCRVGLTGRTDDGAKKAGERCEEELWSASVLAGQGADEGSPGAGDEELVPGQDRDLCDADV